MSLFESASLVVTPNGAKARIKKTDKKFFRYSEQEQIKTSIDTIINKSWLQ